MARPSAQIVRCNLILSRQLVDEVLSVASPESSGNLNQLVTESLREFVARRRAVAFDAAMAQMAADPGVRKECVSIASEFAALDSLGLWGEATSGRVTASERRSCARSRV